MDNSEGTAPKPQTITLSTMAKRRMRTTREETEVLERYYAENTNPTNEQKSKIAEIVQMGPKNVHFWFQNRRAKDNKKKKLLQKYNERKLLKDGLPVGFCRQGFYEDSSLNVKESYEKLRSEQQRLEALKKTQHQKAANQLPPISSLLGQKKSQKGGAGLDISFVFHHPIYGIEASVEQWSRSNKNRV